MYTEVAIIPWGRECVPMTDEYHRRNAIHQLAGPSAPFELVETSIEDFDCRVFRGHERAINWSGTSGGIA